MWTPAQRIVLALMPKFSSTLTFCGSTWVIVEVCSSKQKRSHPYHRLLLAMSVYDVTEAMGNFMSTWPIPEETMYNQVWAVGNRQTCTVQGFVLQLAIAVPIYNAMLALYYMLVINHNVSDRTLRTVVEPCVHAAAFLFSFGTAIVATVMGLFNNSNLWCWIAPYPRGCKDSWTYGDEADCIRGDNYWIFRWAFYFSPLWLCILTATLCTILVYVRVQTLDKQSLRYRRPESFVIRPHGRSSVRQSVRNSIASTAGGPGQMSSVEAAIRQARRELNLLSEEKKDDAFLSGRADNDEDDLMDDAEEPKMNFLGQWRAQRAIYQDDYRRSVEVANQAVWYLGVFYITHVWSTTTRIIQQVRHGKTFFPVILLHSWFDPLQGFLNFVVYQRPRYLKIRKAHPRLGRLGAAWRALRFAYLPPLDVSSSTPLRSSSRWTDRETFSTVPARTQVVADPDPDHGVDKFERHEGDQATKESSALDNSEGSSSASPQAMETHVGPGDNNKNNANEEAQITRPDDSSVVLA